MTHTYDTKLFCGKQRDDDSGENSKTFVQGDLVPEDLSLGKIGTRYHLMDLVSSSIKS